MLFTRYMDNTYLGFYNVPASVLPAVRHFVEIFQHILYEVSFKWQPESQFLNWGACSVMCTDTLSLTMEGVPPVEPFSTPKIWTGGQMARPLVAKLSPRFAVNDPGPCT